MCPRCPTILAGRDLAQIVAGAADHHRREGEASMKSPISKKPDLVMAERQGIEIDYCPKCRGIWLDRGELDKIIERSGVEQRMPPLDRHHDAYKDHSYG
jgi:Zn-finger nucleic acid-binding protein